MKNEVCLQLIFDDIILVLGYNLDHSVKITITIFAIVVIWNQSLAKTFDSVD